MSMQSLRFRVVTSMCASALIALTGGLSGCASKGTARSTPEATKPLAPAQAAATAGAPAAVAAPAGQAVRPTQPEYADGGALERSATITMSKAATGAVDGAAPGAAQVVYKDPLADLPSDELQRTLVDRLATALRDDAMRSDTPVAELARLAVLDTIEPGTFQRVFGALDQSEARSRLNPQELAFTGAWRDMHTQAGNAVNDSGDVSRINASVAGLVEAMGNTQSLAVPKAMLCSKVDGFGVYTEFKRFGDTYKLVAGRKQKLIVYSEVENFSHKREVRDGTEGYTVDLTQDLRLSFSGGADDVLAWRKADERITDFSANRRRDFFVVQIIELPDTLTIGRYNLKVVLRDTGIDTDSTGGVPSGRIAQAVIPIEIVADASAMKDDRTGGKKK